MYVQPSQHVLNTLYWILQNINNFNFLRLPIDGNLGKYIHTTQGIEFQHNLLQTAHIKAGNIYKEY